jgi:hypothetical protein
MAGDTASGEQSVTLQILPVVLFTFFCYLSVGLQMAVLPGYVHKQLGYGEVITGPWRSARSRSPRCSRARTAARGCLLRKQASGRGGFCADGVRLFLCRRATRVGQRDSALRRLPRVGGLAGGGSRGAAIGVYTVFFDVALAVLLVTALRRGWLGDGSAPN